LFNKPFNNELTAAELNQIVAHVLKNEALSSQIDCAKARYSDKRVAVYLSIEILPGRIVLDALLNAGLLEDTKAVFEAEGVNLFKLEDVKDTATGNGGLGRLAACFLDSAAGLGYPVYGAGLYYLYGLFEQKFNEFGRQVEVKDDWTKDGDPWFEPDYDHSYVVDFQNTSVRMVPMKLPIIGYNGGTTNELILWKAEPIHGVTNELASKISDWLYPSDGDDFGKLLRISQEYSFASAQLQMIFDLQIKFLTAQQSHTLNPDFYYLHYQ
jgi:starch phosphorylase